MVSKECFRKIAYHF